VFGVNSKTATNTPLAAQIFLWQKRGAAPRKEGQADIQTTADAMFGKKPDFRCRHGFLKVIKRGDRCFPYFGARKGGLKTQVYRFNGRPQIPKRILSARGKNRPTNTISIKSVEPARKSNAGVCRNETGNPLRLEKKKMKNKNRSWMIDTDADRCREC